MNYETVAYQVKAAINDRPCGTRPCNVEFVGRPSRWCHGCLLAAVWDMRNGERDRWMHVKAQRDELMAAAETVIATAGAEGWLCYRGTDDNRLRVLEDAREKVASGWPADVEESRALNS